MILGKWGFVHFGSAPPPVYSSRAGTQIAGRSGGIFDKRAIPVVSVLGAGGPWVSRKLSLSSRARLVKT